MRTVLFTPALVLLTSVPATEFHIVVRTSDAVEHRITRLCDLGAQDIREPLNVFVDRKPGSASWHPVGGVAPYRVIKESSDVHGHVCFTVVDAEGREAQGCGMIGTRHVESTIPCDDGFTDGMPLKQDTLTKPDVKPGVVTRPVVQPRTPRPSVPMDSKPGATRQREVLREGGVNEGGGRERTVQPRQEPGRANPGSTGTVKPAPGLQR